MKFLFFLRIKLKMVKIMRKKTLKILYYIRQKLLKMKKNISYHFKSLKLKKDLVIIKLTNYLQKKY